MSVLRPATETDRDAVLRWRNHPDVRAASFTRHVIPPDEHGAWWSAALADPTRRILVYERHGVPSGVVQFFDIEDGQRSDSDSDTASDKASDTASDTHTRSAWWSFYLDVDGLEQRGELLPAWLESERDVIRYAFGELALDVLHGELLASNEAMRGLHKRYRMREVGTYDRDVDGTSETVVRVEARADEVRR